MNYFHKNMYSVEFKNRISNASYYINKFYFTSVKCTFTLMTNITRLYIYHKRGTDCTLDPTFATGHPTHNRNTTQLVNINILQCYIINNYTRIFNE